MEEVKQSKRRLVKNADKAAEKAADKTAQDVPAKTVEKTPRKNRKAAEQTSSTEPTNNQTNNQTTEQAKPKRSRKSKTEAQQTTQQATQQATQQEQPTVAKPRRSAKKGKESSADTQSNDSAESAEAPKKSRTPKEAKPKKVKALPKITESYIDKQGISMSVARVKHVLLTCALNEREYYAKNRLYLAEHGPTKPRPTKDNPNPEVPTYTPVHIKDLNDEVVQQVLTEGHQASEALLQSRFTTEVYNRMRDAGKFDEFDAKRSDASKEAKKEGRDFNAFDYLVSTNPKYQQEFAAFKKALAEKRRREEYEHQVETKMTDEVSDKYTKARREQREKLGDDFDLQAFNTSFDKNFYAGLSSFKSRSTEWSEAQEAINKLLTRVAADTKIVLAAFLDQLVMTYLRNGLQQVLSENKRSLQVQHVLKVTNLNNVELDRFVRTLSSYEMAHSYLSQSAMASQRYAETKTRDNNVVLERVEYQLLNKDESKKFGNYIMDLFRHVRNNMALSVKSTSEEAYETILRTSISKEVKHLCCNFVYETITRVGHSIKHNIDTGNTKTVSPQVMRDTITNMLIVCGVPVHNLCSAVNTAVNNFKKIREVKNEKKRS